MKNSPLRLLSSTLILSLVIWILFSWPLPRYLTEGIPSSSQNVEKGNARAMIPGDHLQLLYHFELVRDMARGRIPWFHNVYEFNTGDDAARFRLRGSYLPFSLTYSALAGLLGKAAAWNVVGFLSLWFGAWATAMLAARWSRAPVIVHAAALVALVLPYRWVNLLGGSPTGLAMMWPPFVALGLDRAVRGGSPLGGVLAGAALVLCAWSDVQVVFFCLLSVPFWILLGAGDLWIRNRPVLRSLIRGLWPLALFLLVVLGYWVITHRHLATTGLTTGRALREVRLFSPTWRGFWEWAASGLQSHVYIGWGLPLLLVIGGIAMFARARGKSQFEAAQWTYLLSVAAILDLLILSLGLTGPFNGAIFKLARFLIPPYRMVRQTAKVFCLLPTLCAPALATGLDAVSDAQPARARRTTLILLLLLLTLEMNAQVRPTISLLEPEQPAYEMVAEDARKAGEAPRALIIPIWPGDSSWSSLYQFYVQAYGIRMVNGYSPAVPRAYVENVFRPLEPLNQGRVSEETYNLLRQMGVRYLLVHEDAFPEKVSPFPIGTTLRRLLTAPPLEFMGQARNVWAFRLSDQRVHRSLPSGYPECSVSFPARRWESRNLELSGAYAREDPTVGTGCYVVLDASGAKAVTTPTRVAPIPYLRWWLRARGDGKLNAVTHAGDSAAEPVDVRVCALQWQWHLVPVLGHRNFEPLQLELQHAGGKVEVDVILLVAGDWPLEWKAGDRVTIPAACMFHAGYSEGGAVVFRRQFDPEAAVLYGPKLPLPRGRWRIELEYESAAPEGALLGCMNVRLRETDEAGWVPVMAARPCATDWVQTDNLPVNIVFVYSRNHDVRVERLNIEAVHIEP